MSKLVQRMGDSNDAGGVITSIPQGSVYVNDQLAAVDGSLGTAHLPFIPPHLSHEWVTAGGATSVLIEDIPTNREGDPDSCGHVRVAGSPNTTIG